MHSLRMDYGETKYIPASRSDLSEQVLIVSSERYVGFSYRFHKKEASKYYCASCKLLGKCRVVTVKSGRIFGRKHPEDDHHKDCRPLSNAKINSQSKSDSFSEPSTRSTRDPVSDPSAHDPSVGESRRDDYGDHWKHDDPSNDPKNSVESTHP